MPWTQVYDPLGNLYASALVAAIPIAALLGALAIFRIKAHWAALLALALALAGAILIYGMPPAAAGAAALDGALFGLLPIGWIVLNAMFVYDITVEMKQFEVAQATIVGLAGDRRIQVLLIAFAFGAFLEGTAGFGTPVAICAAMLIGLGFKPLPAAGLVLIGNTAPVAFGGLGTPILALAEVTGLDKGDLSAMVGRQLPFFSLLVPFWLVWALSGFKGMFGVWPACLVAGLAFAIPQFVISNYGGPTLVDMAAAASTLLALCLLLKFWQPRDEWHFSDISARLHRSLQRPARRAALRAWMPWMVLSICIFAWGLPAVKTWLNDCFSPSFDIPNLHNLVQKAPPVAKDLLPEKAQYHLELLSASGTALLLSGVLSGLWLGLKPRALLVLYFRTLKRVRFSLLTIAAMLAFGFTTRYSGSDSTLGLALASTGHLFPFFSPLLGWLGVALTGSDTSSNVMFGNLQVVGARQSGMSPLLAAASNSSGGVMGKMIAAQSIVVASVATGQDGHEGEVLRYVLWHSLVLVCLMGVLVYLQAHVFPGMIPQ